MADSGCASRQDAQAFYQKQHHKLYQDFYSNLVIYLSYHSSSSELQGVGRENVKIETSWTANQVEAKLHRALLRVDNKLKPLWFQFPGWFVRCLSYLIPNPAVPFYTGGDAEKTQNNESLGSQWTTQTYLKHPANVPIHEGSGLETVKLKVVRVTAAGMIPQLIHMPINSHWVTAVGEALGIQRRWDSCPQQDYHEARRQTASATIA